MAIEKQHTMESPQQERRAQYEEYVGAGGKFDPQTFHAIRESLATGAVQSVELYKKNQKGPKPSTIQAQNIAKRTDFPITETQVRLYVYLRELSVPESTGHTYVGDMRLPKKRRHLPEIGTHPATMTDRRIMEQVLLLTGDMENRNKLIDANPTIFDG
jgi:hypothetical protein